MHYRPATSLLFLFFFLSTSILSAQQDPAKKPRARDLGVPFDGAPGKFNAITDVHGVLVGHTTLISGEGKRPSAWQGIDERRGLRRLVFAKRKR